MNMNQLNCLKNSICKYKDLYYNHFRDVILPVYKVRKLSYLLLLIVLFYVQCSNDETKKQDNKILLSALANVATADCIYCTNNKALGGNCTCYSDISLGSCTGMPAGEGKSNSYLISCEDLTSNGTWIPIGENASFCTSKTCPPEAYNAAFTKTGIGVNSN